MSVTVPSTFTALYTKIALLILIATHICGLWSLVYISSWSTYHWLFVREYGFNTTVHPHPFCMDFRNRISANCPACWIGRGPIPFSARSPDLIPLYYFLCEYLKSLVNEPPVNKEWIFCILAKSLHSCR